MSQTKDSIVAYLELLHANRQLIAQAYANGGATLDESNQRQMHKLVQSRVLMPYLQNDYRLNVSLANHLNEVFQRQRRYMVGANFSELIARLEPLAQEYATACLEGRLQDQESYADEFDVAVFELAMQVGKELLDLRVITENQFANVATLAEKQRQNEFYLGRAEKIGEAIALLTRDSICRLLQHSEVLRPLYLLYQQQILSRQPEWRATHLDITAVLKAFLYRLRRIAPEARYLRTFAHYLRQNPDYQPPDADELASLPEWSSRFTGIRLQPQADLSQSVIAEALEDVAANIPAAALSFAKPREAGRLRANDEQAVSVMQPKPVQQAFHRYLAAAGRAEQPLSALNWKQQQTEFQQLPDQAWLLYVVHAVQMLQRSKNQPDQKFIIQRHTAAPHFERSGNIAITDITVCGQAAAS